MTCPSHGVFNQLTLMIFVSAIIHHIYNEDADRTVKQEEAPG